MTRGEIRRAAARLAQIGLLDALEPDDAKRPTQYVAVTAAGETITLDAAETPAYLRGLAHGAFVRDQQHGAVLTGIDR